MARHTISYNSIGIQTYVIDNTEDKIEALAQQTLQSVSGKNLFQNKICTFFFKYTLFKDPYFIIQGYILLLS